MSSQHECLFFHDPNDTYDSAPMIPPRVTTFWRLFFAICRTNLGYSLLFVCNERLDFFIRFIHGTSTHIKRKSTIQVLCGTHKLAAEVERFFSDVLFLKVLPSVKGTNPEIIKLCTTLQSMMNAKLSLHRFWHYHENRLIKTMSPSSWQD